MTSEVLSFFGSLTIDDLVLPDGSTRWAVPGGNVVYAALGALVWSPDIEIVAPLSRDYPIGLLEGKIDLSRCRPASHTLRNWGLYEDDGRRRFVSRSNSRDWRQFCPEPGDARSGVQTAAHVAAMPRDVAIALIRELRAQETLMISLDLDDRDLSGAVAFDETMELIRSADVFLPSWQDVLEILEVAEPIEALRQLRELAREPLLIAIKCGANGVYAHARGEDRWIHVAAADVAVIDTTGAGDAFCGGFLARFARDRDAVEGLICGAVSASFCIEQQGFSGLLSVTGEGARLREEEIRRGVSTGAFATMGLQRDLAVRGAM